MPARHDAWDMVAPAQRKAAEKYAERVIKQYNFRLNVRTDLDLIRFLDAVPNRQGLIKQLLRAELGRRDAEEADKKAR